MMGTGKPAQIICHLLELLKDNRRLPAPAGCPAEVTPLPRGVVGTGVLGVPPLCSPDGLAVSLVARCTR